MHTLLVRKRQGKTGSRFLFFVVMNHCQLRESIHISSNIVRSAMICAKANESSSAACWSAVTRRAQALSNNVTSRILTRFSRLAEKNSLIDVEVWKAWVWFEKFNDSIKNSRTAVIDSIETLRQKYVGKLAIVEFEQKCSLQKKDSSSDRSNID